LADLSDTGPKRHLGSAQAGLLVLGMILSTDTLKTAPTVALNVDGWGFYGVWLLGGVLSLIGALCYVEMATAFPDPGGDYAFLRRAYGPDVGLLFAWSRFSIIHTGWIALMAYLLADYAAAVWPLGHEGRMLFALATVAALTGLNLAHVRLGFLTQAALVLLVTLGFLSVGMAAVKLAAAGVVPPPSPIVPTRGAVGHLSVALIYVFLAYGGWSDGATLSAEVRSDRRGMLVAIVGGLAALTVIYLALNAAMRVGLGPTGLAHSAAPAAEVMGRAFGPVGKALIVGIVGVSAVASINSTLIVGARTTAAAARDAPGLGGLSHWHGGRGVPARAVLAEGACALVLVGAAGAAPSGFNAMVGYMTPVYWFFIALSMGAAMILRRRYPDAPRPVRLPLDPLLPGLFLVIAVSMLWASLKELGGSALYGAGVLAAGAAALALLRAATRRWPAKAWSDDAAASNR
jgi:basic amino acid/polyamine antiporter, APA family